MFQERLDKVIRLLPAIIGIADDILTHGSTIKEMIQSHSTLGDCKTKQSHTKFQEDAVQITRLFNSSDID